MGRVVLVGAGPGDPGLITVAGLAALRRADVVVYDALANPRLLDEAPPHAERIDAGKRSRQHKLTQDETNQLLVDLARAGKFVVRLKGGDPYLFGRGAEEAAYLARQGVECEVVPGITSGIAAPMYAGIPVTHRDYASSVTFVTGHEDPLKPMTAVDYGALARLISGGGTVCIYMGVGRLREIAEALTAGGAAASTPIAAVQWGTLPRQRQARATLADAADAIARAGIEPPAMIVVGAVAALDELGLDFFTRRPLFGQTMLVTRTRRQASELRERLEERGAEVLEAPTIEVGPPASWEGVDAALRGLAGYAVVALTSANAVEVLADRLEALRLDARALGPCRVAAVGPGTVEALRQRLCIRADIVPDRNDGGGLAEAIIATMATPGRALLLRADIAGPALRDRLVAARWDVHDVEAYATRAPTALPAEVLEALRSRRVRWLTFTSASTARNLVKLLGDERSLLDGVQTASIGPITSAAMREQGLVVTVEAVAPSVESLAAAVARHCSRR